MTNSFDFEYNEQLLPKILFSLIQSTTSVVTLDCVTANVSIVLNFVLKSVLNDSEGMMMLIRKE